MPVFVAMETFFFICFLNLVFAVSRNVIFPLPFSFIKTLLEVEGPDLFLEDDPRSNFLEMATFASPVCPLFVKRD